VSLQGFTGSFFYCRVYAYALLVLDDTDFHERQDTFTLSQQRGIATALNALVFRTYCPTVSGQHVPHPSIFQPAASALVTFSI